MHHRNVRVIDLFVARIILEIAGVTISFMILMGFFIALGLMKPPEDILKIMFGWALLAWFASGFALLLGAASAVSEVVDRVWHVIAYLFLPLSGAFFMVDWLPRPLQELVLLVPIVNCTELIREGIFGAAVRAHYDAGYVVAFNVALMLPSLLLIRYASLRVEGE
jgi:capsular polysaccharide transport system permease protein